MSGVLKVLLWTLLAAGVAVAAVVGFGVFRLSQIYPDADEGKALAEQIESQLGSEHPGFTVEASAHASFAEVVVTVQPLTGELTVPEVPDVLRSLEAALAEHSGSRWSIESTITGRWDGTSVDIRGSDAGRWAELAPVLEVAGDSRTELSLHLDQGQAVVRRDRDVDRLCGPGVDPRDFFTDTVTEASATLTDVGWVGPEDPVLVYLASGCEGPRRTAVFLSGEDRSGRVEDLEALISSLPAGQVITGVTVEESGDLMIAVEGDVPATTAPGLAGSWSHGQVWLNGELATAR